MLKNMGPLWEKMPISRAFFYMSLKFLNKSYPNKKKNLILLSKGLGKERPHHVEEHGASMEKDAHFQGLT